MRRTVEVAPAGPRPSISLRPAPPCEPPFDDEVEPATWATAHQLALDWAPPVVGPAAGERPGASVRVADRGVAMPSGARPPMGRPASGPASGQCVPAGGGVSHDAKLAVHRFVRMCVEVFNGHRPPAHLRHLSRPSEAGNVVAQGLIGAHRVAAMRKASHPPGRRPPRRPPPVAVIRLRLCEPRPGAVEAAVALVTGERTWALALRMELHQESWSATALRLV